MQPQPQLWDEIVVDNFAGGGGASTGIKMAIGRDVDIAINHDPAAIAMHKANHPFTEHYNESVWDIDPVTATGGRPVGLCWFSPDCKHFSRAKGGKPVDKNIRGLAWIALPAHTTTWAVAISIANTARLFGQTIYNAETIFAKKSNAIHCLKSGLVKQTHKNGLN
ncbi:hypothetical protein [Phascolarctobacterium sp.]|uniref:hypothetical protein n=1 Tax=Phascolarctobacterium sp. TaxID=2049039 RepID=UPI003043EDFC